MKLFTKLGLLTMFAVILAGLTSCDDNKSNGDTETEQYFRNCYTAATSATSGATNITARVVVYLRLNWTQQTASMQFSSITIGSNALPNLSIENLKWTQDKDGWGTIKVPVVQAKGANGSLYTLNDFEFRWQDRLDLGNALESPELYCPVMEFSMDCNGYEISGSRLPVIAMGTTVSSAPGVEPFSSNRTYYWLDINFDTRKASLSLGKAQFANGMPAMDMTFPDLPFTIDEDAHITIQAAALIPTINDVPQPEFPISNLNIEYDGIDGMDVEFDCNVRKARMYHVQADNLNYLGFRNWK